MSEPLLARYDFLAHYRRGAVADLDNPDPLSGPLPARGALQAALTVHSTAGSDARDDPTATPISLLGPGDVVGIDPRHVIRTEPRNGTMNFEPNYLAGIDFDHPELPWLFTPAAPTGDRVRPWIALLALADGEFTPSPRAPSPLPAIEISSTALLPDLNDSWAWAHVQVSGGMGTSTVEALQTNEPGRVQSRLLCPRRLTPRTRYTAFLVPAFDLGVKAGLGEDASGAQAQPGWSQAAAASIVLPVYYRFEFQTAAAGDFESLVRALVPRVMPGRVGIRPMAVDRPGWGMPSAGAPLGLGGALRSVQTQDSAWADPERSTFQNALASELNRSGYRLDDPAHDPVVEPPLYGRWHAAKSVLNPAGAGWFEQLNADPRPRATGGMGTRVVVEEHNQLMHAAWEQVDGIRRANQFVRQAQLAQAASHAVLDKHFAGASPGMVLALTQPLHSKLLASPRTVAATIDASRLPPAAVSPAFRRVACDRGAIARRQARGGERRSGLVTRLASGEITPLPPYRGPDGMVVMRQRPADAQGARGPLRPQAAAPSPFAPAWLAVVAVLVVLALIAAILTGGALAWVAFAVVVAAAVALVAARAQRTPAGADHFPDGPAAPAAVAAPTHELTGGVTEQDLTPEAFLHAPAWPDFHVVESRNGSGAGSAPIRGPVSAGAVDSPAGQAFRRAAAAVAQVLRLPPPEIAVRPRLDVASLAETVLGRVNPRVTVPAWAQARIAIEPGVGRTDWDPLRLDEVMAAPDFPQPMYEPLRDLDQELLLPGLELIPRDTVSLLLENRRFIEGYMVGLNHEMARQLLWNSYPTDQRGSPFRQFWDVRGYVPTPADPTDPAALVEQLKDIPPVHRWPLTHALGHNPNRVGANDSLVLLVRGELLRRYPNTVVYACRAVWSKSAQRHDIPDPEVHRHPQFRGTLTPDITFFGFDLTVDEARGNPSDKDNSPGWFFVFQEQPTEPRFGLEPELDPFAQPTVKEWNDLTWGHLATDAGALAQLRYAKASAPLHGTIGLTTNPDGENPGDVDNHWGTDAAQMAFITMRRPVRVAIHAEMMLPSP